MAKDSGRGAQLYRVLRILEILQARRYGVTLDELSDEFDVHTRTIRRDLEDLMYAGFEIEKMRIDGANRYVLDDAHRKAVTIAFNAQELAALMMSWKLMLRMEGTPFYAGVDSLIAKVRASIPEPTTELLYRLERIFWAKFRPHKNYGGQRDLLELLQGAAEERRKVKLTYRAYNRPKDDVHTVRPYRLVFYDGGVYLACWSETRKALRTFSVDRIVNADFARGTFEIDESLDLDTYLENSFGIINEGEEYQVVIRFNSALAQHIRERQWHPSQKIKELKGGEVRLTMQIPGFTDLINWLAPFGANAEVESPPELRARVADLHRKAAEIYE